ncbi:MAG: CaiB/BaiF CoA transferase family protein [Minwuia sp.]|uniref:CaiB/BaiF CoA transferase family protein n=1 Tax=Minwuia sp. TaxID=2493630 RepID=UPI003A849A57
MASGWAGPLAGLKVLDLTRVLAGPYATQSLGDLGAEVWKVEPPDGDDTRRFPPFVGGESHYFLALNRSKKSLAIDLKQADGQALLRRLAAEADILVENYRPGVMARLGLDYGTLSALNPGLIYCSISGFGQTGPLKDKPAFDIVTQAMSGALSVNGEKGRAPVKLGLPLGDMVGGVYGPIAILAAVHERHATGRGRLIDISLQDGLIGMLGYLAQLAFVTDEDPQPVGSMHPTLVPYGAFPASDGQIVIAVLSEAFWPKLCRALGRPDLAGEPRFATLADRRENRDELEAIVSGITAQQTVAEWEARLEAHDVPHAPILGVGAALDHPHAKVREMVVTAEHPSAGDIRMTGRPVKFPGAPQTALTAPPRLGEHTVEVLRDVLGCQETELGDLAARGVIGGQVADAG